MTARTDPATLLAGPRGRVFCMAVAHRLHDAVRPAWLQAAWHPSDGSRLAELIRALDAVDVTQLLASGSPALLVDAVAETVDHAMYWQPPHAEDLIAADPAVVAALHPVAAALADADAVAWWNSGVDLSLLRYTGWADAAPTAAPPVTGAAEQLVRWREETLADERRAARDRPADPTASFGGRWWSTPALVSLVTTTRPLPGLGSAELVWQEDSPGRREASVCTLQPKRAPRVWEIDGPDAWARLVDRYSLDVNSSRRHDWYRATGRSRRWCIPDWVAVAADWDAVHVSVAGYLTTATRAVILADGESATVLAGWNPDQTWWLSDVLAVSSSPHLWRRTDDDASGAARHGWVQLDT